MAINSSARIDGLDMLHNLPMGHYRLVETHQTAGTAAGAPLRWQRKSVSV